MILTTAILIILIEAIGEGILKRFKPTSFIFDNYIQWVIAIFLFALWFIWAYHFDGYYVLVAKLIIGFVFVRFAIFDVAWNIARGVKWNYYGTTKLYDRIMFELAEWGWMVKIICGIIGVCFLMGLN
jgi:hypothetical protein